MVKAYADLLKRVRLASDGQCVPTLLSSVP